MVSVVDITQRFRMVSVVGFFGFRRRRKHFLWFPSLAFLWFPSRQETFVYGFRRGTFFYMVSVAERFFMVSVPDGTVFIWLFITFLLWTSTVVIPLLYRCYTVVIPFLYRFLYSFLYGCLYRFYTVFFIYRLSTVLFNTVFILFLYFCIYRFYNVFIPFLYRLYTVVHTVVILFVIPAGNFFIQFLYRCL